jgi:hypothetical protein
VPIHSLFFKDGSHVTFSNIEMGILSKVKEFKELRGGGPWDADQAIPPIDAGIGQKDHLWLKTSLSIKRLPQSVAL